PDVEALEAAVGRARDRVRAGWAAARARVEALLRNAPLDRSSFRTNVIADALADMDAFAGAPNPPAELPERFDRFTSARLVQGAKQPGWRPDDPFVELCDELARADAAWKAGHVAAAGWLRGALLTYATRELARRKAERGIQFYDDLLLAL